MPKHEPLSDGQLHTLRDHLCIGTWVGIEDADRAVHRLLATLDERGREIQKAVEILDALADRTEILLALEVRTFGSKPSDYPNTQSDVDRARAFVARYREEM